MKNGGRILTIEARAPTRRPRTSCSLPKGYSCRSPIEFQPNTFLNSFHLHSRQCLLRGEARFFTSLGTATADLRIRERLDNTRSQTREYTRTCTGCSGDGAACNTKFQPGDLLAWTNSNAARGPLSEEWERQSTQR